MLCGKVNTRLKPQPPLLPGKEGTLGEALIAKHKLRDRAMERGVPDRVKSQVFKGFSRKKIYTFWRERPAPTRLRMCKMPILQENWMFLYLEVPKLAKYLCSEEGRRLNQSTVIR